MNRVCLLLGFFAALVMAIAGCNDSDDSAAVNAAPEISSLTTDKPVVSGGERLVVSCAATDPDGDQLEYHWTAPQGYFYTGVVNLSSAGWLSPAWELSMLDTAEHTIHISVSDGEEAVHDSLVILRVNGDLWYDTGEPFIDQADQFGVYNGVYDVGEVWLDLPSTYPGNPLEPRFDIAIRNGIPDRPNGALDEYELFTYHADIAGGDDPRLPVIYSWNNILENFPIALPEWFFLPDIDENTPGYMAYIPDTSTWKDRNHDGLFTPQHD